MPAYTITKPQIWTGEMADQPGSLANILEALTKAGAQLDCVIARRQPEKPGTGVVYLTPVKGKRAQAAAASVGLQAAPNIATLCVEGPYRPDAGAAMARAVAQAGINVRGVSGVKVGSKLVAYIGFDSQQDADAAAKAINALGKAAKAPAKKRAKPKR